MCAYRVDQELDGDNETLKKRAHAKVWNSQMKTVRVIFSTLATAASKEMRGVNFEIVLVDEAALVSEWSLVCCLRRTIQTLLLLGDIKQNPPFCLYEPSPWSILELLLQNTRHYDQVIKLNTQYRCHEFICSLVEGFYDYKIYTAAKVSDDYLEDLEVHGRIVGHRRESRAWMIDLRGKFNSRDLCNPTEVQEIFQLLLGIERVLKRQSLTKTVNILTPYKAQKVLLDGMISKNFSTSRNVEISVEVVESNEIAVQTFDGCQGTEANVIILSLTRSGNRSQGLGFLANRLYRCLVPITRAKDYLFVVGDFFFFTTDANWNSILTKIKCYVQV